MTLPHLLRKPVTRLDLYLCGELFLTILFAVMLFTIVWLAPDTLFKLIQYVFSGKITLMQAGTMFLYHIPGVLQQTIPIAVLLGSIFLFQRLSQNYELIALMASGISPARIMTGVLWMGLLFGGLHWVVQETVIPYTAPRLEKYYTTLDIKDAQDRNFVFVEKNHRDRLDKFFMIGQIQKAVLSDFVVLYYTETGDQGVQISRILRSKTGSWNPKKKQWKLINGIEYVLNEEGVYKDIRRFAEQQVRTDKYAAELLKYTRMNPMAMPGKELKKYIKRLKEGGQLQDVPFYQVRLYQKWAAPVASVIFALLGAMLGMERIRTNRTYGLLFGAMVIFVYSILMPFTSNFGSLDLVPPVIVAWVPLAITLLTAGVILGLRPRQG